VVFRIKPTDDESGYYLLRSNLKHTDAKRVFDIFTMLLDVKDAFRSMKYEFLLRPVASSKRISMRRSSVCLSCSANDPFKAEIQGIAHGWATIRDTLSTHYRVTTSLKRSGGKVVYLRKNAKPEECHTRIYKALSLPIRPCKTSKIIL
jgi:hypothetical protein